MTWECDDLATGEDYFVEAATKEEAMAIAKEYFEQPRVFGTVTEFEAEVMGYDTY